MFPKQLVKEGTDLAIAMALHGTSTGNPSIRKVLIQVVTHAFCKVWSTEDQYGARFLGHPVFISI